jgi:acyl-coenzyme A thioesterase PaaI-like protein
MQRSLGDGGMPLLGRLGLGFESYGEGWAEAAWAPTALACNPAGIVHGGVYGVILRAAQAGDALRVRGEVVRVTRQVGYVRSAVRNADGELVSEATSTCLLRRRDA